MFDFRGLGFPWLDNEVKAEYIERVLVPTLLLTVLYFLIRFLSGKNPTSTLWPVYVILSSWLICNFFAFFWLPLNLPLLMGIVFNASLLLIIRSAHNKRKNEIF